jgi:hypothetical protein
MAAVTDATDTPHEGECLTCYVTRMVEAHGCDLTLRWARLFRDAAAPADDRLERRLEADGGTCDCEVPIMVWTPVPPWATGPPFAGEPLWPGSLPPCAGAVAGSTAPCLLWEQVGAW